MSINIVNMYALSINSVIIIKRRDVIFIIIGKNIKRLRESKNISARELSRRSGVSQGYLSQLETGKNNNPTNDVLKKLADGLNVEHEYMLYLAGVIDEDSYNAKVKTKKMIKEFGEGIKKSYIDDSTTLLSFAGFNLHELPNDKFSLARSDATGNTIRISKEELESLINEILDYNEYKVKQFHNRLDDKDHFFISQGELFIDESDKEGD